MPLALADAVCLFGSIQGGKEANGNRPRNLSSESPTRVWRAPPEHIVRIPNPGSGIGWWGKGPACLSLKLPLGTGHMLDLQSRSIVFAKPSLATPRHATPRQAKLSYATLRYATLS